MADTAPPITNRDDPVYGHLADDAWWSQPEPCPHAGVPGCTAWGWTSLTELRWLNATARGMESVVEVGSLHGRSALALLDGCTGPVYCIDPFNDAGHWCIKSFLESCGHHPNLRTIVGYSPAVIDTYHLPDVDFTFIDGAHDEASVRADIEGWLPKTRRVLAGHDYVKGGGYPDVAVVVDEIFGDRVRVAEGTAIWYVDDLNPQPSTSTRKPRSRVQP